MAAGKDTLQRITTLTPLAEVFLRIDALASPVAAKTVPVDGAAGAVLAEDVLAPEDIPTQPIALHDGWAVTSDQVIDASSYSPATLQSRPLWIEAGQEMPTNTDAILPADALSEDGGEAYAAAAHGEGVLSAGTDAAKGAVLRKAGERLRPLDAAVLRALGMETVSVRFPSVGIVLLSESGVKNDFVGSVIANAVRAAGGVPHLAELRTLEGAFEGKNFDAIIGIGGTGSGKSDHAVKSLARLGYVACHGVGVLPGRTAALGSVNGCAVLLLPGRLDAALSAFLIVGKRLLARLAGSSEDTTGEAVLLTKKVTSTIGMTEVVFVRRVTGGVEPLGSGIFSLEALARADGWILVPAASEGCAAGATVEMRSIA